MPGMHRGDQTDIDYGFPRKKLNAQEHRVKKEIKAGKKRIKVLSRKMDVLENKKDKIEEKIEDLQKKCRHQNTKYIKEGVMYVHFECVDCGNIMLP